VWKQLLVDDLETLPSGFWLRFLQGRRRAFLFSFSVYGWTYLQKLKLNVVFKISLEGVQVTQYENTI
jgi:hypothetical protein